MINNFLNFHIKIMKILNESNFKQVLLTQDFKNLKWLMVLVYILKILPEHVQVSIIIYLQCQFLNYVEWKHKQKTFGGFLENRAELIGFLETSCQDKCMIHLGIDINNIKPGIDIKTPCDVSIVHVFKDTSLLNGWGGRVIMKMNQKYKNSSYLIFGHLSHNLPNIGDTFKRGEIIGQLGDTHENGGWFPHLHVQCISQKFFDEYRNKLNEIDGYMFKDNIKFSEYVDDPTELIL
jgi:hypothetical protein